VKILAAAKKVPVERAHSFGVFNTVLLNQAASAVDFDFKVRNDL
jgi:hypothetical protein